jgi:hypothetical protein
MAKQKNEIQLLNQKIKQAIFGVDLKSKNARDAITALLKLCDVALKVKKLDLTEEQKADANPKTLSKAELCILESYIKELKEKHKLTE